MKKIIWILLISFVIFSCKKEDDTVNDNITVTLNESGYLSVNVIESNGNGVADAAVRIYSSIPEGMIYFDSTDANGNCNIGKLLQGQYSFRVSAEKNNKVYTDAQNFQVIAGDTRIINVNPFTNVGIISVKIVDYESYPIPDVHVALIPHPSYSNTEYTFDDLIAEAYFIEITDTEGWVSFYNVPAGAPYSTDYSVMAYFDSANYSYPYSGNSLRTYRNTEQKFTVVVGF